MSSRTIILVNIITITLVLISMIWICWNTIRATCATSREHPLYMSQSLNLTKKKKLGDCSPSFVYISVLYQLTICVNFVTVRSSCVYK